jgi:predicted Rossmann fold flavoprotein
MSQRRVVVAGGGASGFFAAVTAAESAGRPKVLLIEKGPQFLAKVRISGGGRCNVTHACFEPRELSGYYPRGGPALLGAFQAFQPRDTIEWFEARGVKLKTEADGRMFPVTDSSRTITDCLEESARRAGVEVAANRGLVRATRRPGSGFDLELSDGEAVGCDRLLLATGGCRVASGGALAEALGHTIEPPVPSLFTFQVEAEWLRKLAGITLPEVGLAVAAGGLRERGAALITHAGLSGPAVLRLSAVGARELHGYDYRFRLRINWAPGRPPEELTRAMEMRRRSQAARRVVNGGLTAVPARLWEGLVKAAGIGTETRWADLTRSARHRLIQQLGGTELEVTGKSLNREEFVTCGGVRLREVNFRTMESRICPGLYLSGELLDIDGLTGGFNFQSAWTTGWLAGRAMGGEGPANQ